MVGSDFAVPLALLTSMSDGYHLQSGGPKSRLPTKDNKKIMLN